MTRFVVDCGVVLRLAEERLELGAGHELLAPTLLRSQTLSALHEAVHRGELPPDVALARLEEITRMITKLPIRLLGDAVLRRNAWQFADRLGWGETSTAEYVALTHLRPTRSSRLMRSWLAASRASSPQRRSTRCARPDMPSCDCSSSSTTGLRRARVGTGCRSACDVRRSPVPSPRRPR